MDKYTFLTFEVPGDRLEQGRESLEELLSKAFTDSPLLKDRKLSRHELYCLVLAAQGMTSRETSRLLCIAKDTVESHRKNARLKLKSKNMVNAVLQAIKYELKMGINADPALVRGLCVEPGRKIVKKNNN